MGPVPEKAQELKVSDLMKPASTEWDIEKINNFLPEYKDAILTLKPSKLGICQKALPVGVQLQARCIPVNPKCCRCEETESILHLLFHCPFVKEVWNRSHFSLNFNPLICENVMQGLEAAQSLITLPPIGLDRGFLYPSQSLSTAPESSRSTIRHPPVCQPQGTITCCTDAAWLAEPRSAGSAGLGWIFHSDEGQVSSYSSALSYVSSALVAEALAIRQALLIKAITSNSLLLEPHVILKDIALLISSFDFLQCKFIPRVDNVVADFVVKHALRVFNSSRE
ncbi:unnamed protein product [Microthlaspi erraticum]|uniref:Reverse transcriptase zinc-binding domain-containing protein n=1 Tax=Microthlaspi erraticum TaxID=1685480 RepID=A0A6D2HZ22_9BRAS|nr:unnamed protein product [Microthlaspi erraticum]